MQPVLHVLLNRVSAVLGEETGWYEQYFPRAVLLYLSPTPLFPCWILLAFVKESAVLCQTTGLFLGLVFFMCV